MDLSTLTQDQRDCVTHVRGPLLVSAGAGSGKTLMLTQRIAYALLHPEESGVGDIDEVLAITFTELAASEIKARVRTRLREEGLAEAALKVDACWISTIHGMCSRILHESALDLGLDPRFGLIGETDRDQLLEACVNEVLEEARGEDGGGAALDAYRELFDEFEKADGDSNVGAMVREVVGSAANLRGGLDAVVCAEVPAPRDVARDVHQAAVACDAVACEGISKTGRQETFTSKAFDALRGEGGAIAAFERLAADPSSTYVDVALALKGIDLSFGRNTSKEPFATGYALFRKACADARLVCALGLARRARDQLLDLARRVQGRFDAAKEARGVLDQNDLLVRTLEAFETHPEVLARYRDRFKLVMVDEFQDTSGLQVALIGYLTDGDRRLCTVGDTQQSIYRFRGADVDTYRAHKRAMRRHEHDGTGGMYRELGKNFRSHGDVIAFVNRVFGAPEVFGAGGEFIKLSWDEGHADANPFPDVARVDVVATTSRRQGGVNTEDRHLVEAEAVARRFEALHADAPNRRWGDMVILLGSMGRADVYARTLRAHGIPCIVTGGSGFAQTPEAREVSALLGAVANPWDDANLRAALTGGTFGLGAEELLRLGSADDGGQRHLWTGLLAARGGDPSPRVRLAAALLCDAVATAGGRGAAQILTDLVVSSGWLDRLQGAGPQGMASAANALKAVRLAEAVENDPATPRGIPATAARVARELAAGVKEKPGTLMTADQDAVRILTIHASKGLEFPVVALADFYGARTEGSRLRLETAGDRLYLSLLPSASVAEGMPLEKLHNGLELTETQRGRLVDAGYLDLLKPPEMEEAEGALELHRAIAERRRTEELGEMRRRFYVGATRPREALVVAVNMEDRAVDPSKERAYGGVLDDLRRALFGQHCDFVTAPDGIDFGGKRRATTERLRLERDERGRLLVNGKPAEGYLRPEMADADMADEAGSGAQAPGAHSLGGVGGSVPEPPRPGERLRDLLPGKRPCNPLRAGTFSYSRLARDAHPAGEPADPDEVWDPARATWDDEATDADETLAAAPATRAGAPGDEGTRRPASPVAFGSALHQACQLMAEQLAARGEPRARFEVPSDERLRACLRAWDADDDELPALRDAVTLWATSEVAAEAAAYADVTAEAPFYVTLQGPQGEPVHLEGSIDLLCRDHRVPAAQQTAFVVDYKTGGRASETPAALQEKHLLQATCYAYAVLLQGYAAVEFAFVRVQHRDPSRPDQPQTVRYRFERGRLQDLHEAIRTAYGEATAMR